MQKHFPIWHLSNKAVRTIKLFKTDDLNFIIIEDGEWCPVLSGSLFIIVNKELLGFFQSHLDNSIDSDQVSIYDKELNKYFEDYYRLYILEQIDAEKINNIDSSGRKIWRESSGQIFVSLAVKKEMEEVGIEGIRFYPGFSRFAG